MPYFLQRIFKPIFEKYLTVLLYGPRSQGKSLHQAKLAMKILKYLDNVYTHYPTLPQSIIVSNQLFSEKIEAKYLAPYNVVIGKKQYPMARRLYYWESIHQLKKCPREQCWKGNDEHVLHDAYILFDDIATIIPADGWQDLPKWFRKIFAQAGHNGVHCIANVQDPVSCDINFRRYVDVALKFHKLIGSPRPEAAKPPVKNIWGFYTIRQISAEELYKHGDKTEEEIAIMKKENPELHKRNWNISIHWIGRKHTEIYNTLQNVPEYMPNKLEHIEMTCVDPNCKEGHKGQPFVHIKHRPI